MLTAALDERIGGVIAASCVSTFVKMMGVNPAGPDYVIPGILKWLECADVVTPSAPRPFVTVSGTSDRLFPFWDVEPVTIRAREVYAALGAENCVRTLPAKGGHGVLSKYGLARIRGPDGVKR
jgi:hypothetical protein